MDNIYESWLCTRPITHMGLFNAQLPENSLGAFENAVKHNYPIELDVRIIEDGTIIVFHDEDLNRMCNKDKYFSTLTKKDLKDCKLNNTDFCIPTFEEVLKVVNGKVPLLIEIKNEGKVGELESKLYDMLKNYKGEYAVQSFNPYSLEWFKNNAPEVIRGQLSASFKGVKLSNIKKYILKRLLANKISEPHFICYEHACLPNKWVSKCEKQGLPIIAWTIRNKQEYLQAIQVCDNVVFEQFEPTL